jgi:polar amino acid transport system substrate-binding protein
LLRLNQSRLALFATIFLVAICGANVTTAQDNRTFAGFRHVDPQSAAARNGPERTVILLADQDFAPWSFIAESGELSGIAVDVAKEACKLAGLRCDIKGQPFAALLPALQNGEALGIIAGPKTDAATARTFALTRPYFFSLGRFVVRNGSALATADTRTLAGRRLGFVANSAHARFLEEKYGRSALTPFDTASAMLEALRTGQIDAGFGDAVQLSYWLAGSNARGCCSELGRAFLHRGSFSRSLSFILRRDDDSLRERLDAALDQMESSGETAAVFQRYLPRSVW